MKWLIFVGLLAILSGCSGTAWETVDDIQPQEPVEVWQREAYAITVSLPKDAVLLRQEAGYSCYCAAETGLEVTTQVFLASDLDSALRQLTQLPADRLLVVQTTRFGLPEYQFAWYQPGEPGQMCRADLVMDGMTCYAVICATPETAGDAMGSAVREVIATFGLYYDEQV